MLSATNLSHRIGAKVLVDGLNFTLVPGSFTGVLGANGAGKSSLLKLLCGDYSATQGQVTLSGRTLQDWQPRALARQRAVMLQQQKADFDFSVLDYLMLARACHDETHQQCLNAVAHVMAELDLLAFSSTKINLLSGGEMQRVAFARCWLQVMQQLQHAAGSHFSVANSLLLLDEPTSALDIRQQHGFFTHIQRFCQQGGTVLSVLHDINSAARFCDHLLLMKNGRQVAFGSVDKAFTAAAIEDCFAVKGQIHSNPQSQRPYFDHLM